PRDPGKDHRDGVTTDGAESAPRLRVRYGEDAKESKPPLKRRVETHTASAQDSSVPVPWRWSSRGAGIGRQIDRRAQVNPRKLLRSATPKYRKQSGKFGPGGPGPLPARGSHRPVRARIRAYGSSTSRFAAHKGPRSYSIKLRGPGLEPRCVPQVSLDRVCWLTLRFPPQGSPGRVPLLRRYHQSATTSCRPSRRASFPFAWRYLSVHSFFSLRSGRVRRRGLELVTRYLRPGSSRRRRQDLPGSRETPIVRLPCSVDAGRTAGTRPVRCRSVAPGM